MESVALLGTVLRSELSEINDMLLSIDCNVDEHLLSVVVAHIAKSSGKRLRPMLTVASSRIFCDSYNRNSVFLAVAVELIHTATILHDDVIDQSLIRRGNRTVNSVWDNKTSVLVGDYLFSQSFGFMIKTQLLDALQSLSEASSQISRAEIWQLELIGVVGVSVADYMKLITQKTAVLFASACKVGAIAAAAPPEAVENLYQYGLNFGIVFQILDDYLDYFGTKEIIGKGLGGDYLESKITLPLLLLLTLANDSERSRLEAMIISNNKNAGDVLDIVQMMNKYDIKQKIKLFARPYVDRGIAAIDQLRQGCVSDYLKNILIESTERIR